MGFDSRYICQDCGEQVVETELSPHVCKGKKSKASTLGHMFMESFISTSAVGPLKRKKEKKL